MLKKQRKHLKQKREKTDLKFSKANKYKRQECYCSPFLKKKIDTQEDKKIFIKKWNI